MLYLLSYGHQARMGFYQRKDAGQSVHCARILCRAGYGRTAALKYADPCLTLAVDFRYRGNDGLEGSGVCGFRRAIFWAYLVSVAPAEELGLLVVAFAFVYYAE